MGVAASRDITGHPAGIGNTVSKIDDIDFPSFSAEDRGMLIEPMNALKDILEPGTHHRATFSRREI